MKRPANTAASAVFLRFGGKFWLCDWATQKLVGLPVVMSARGQIGSGGCGGGVGVGVSGEGLGGWEGRHQGVGRGEGLVKNRVWGVWGWRDDD